MKVQILRDKNMIHNYLIAGVKMRFFTPLSPLMLMADSIIKPFRFGFPDVTGIFCKKIQINTARKYNYKRSITSKDRPLILFLTRNNELIHFFTRTFSDNYRFVQCSSVAESTKIIGEKRLAVVIADMLNSDPAGFELCKKMKNNVRTCHIPFVFLTANTSKQQIIKGYELGADDFINIPLDVNLFNVKIDMLIKNRDLIKENLRVQNLQVEKVIPVLKDEFFIKKVKLITKENLSDPEFNVNTLAEKMNMSSTNLYRKLKPATGFSPVEFIRRIRLQNAYYLLSQGYYDISEVGYKSGFNNISYFIKCFKGRYAVTPGQFRDGLISKNQFVSLRKSG